MSAEKKPGASEEVAGAPVKPHETQESADISEDLAAALLQYRTELLAHHEETEQKVLKVRLPSLLAIERKLRERQPLLDAVPSLWPTVLGAPNCPLAENMGSKIDVKVIRAVQSVEVVTAYNDAIGIESKKVLVKLSPNIFIKDGTLWLNQSRTEKKFTWSGVQWKPGTEKLREKSLFLAFDSGVEDNVRADVLCGFDEVFQNPMLYAQE